MLQELKDLLYLLTIENERGERAKGTESSWQLSPSIISFNPQIPVLVLILHVLWVRKPKW